MTDLGTDPEPAESLSAEVGRRLRERRHERSETLADVAETAEISTAHLAEIETGKSFCSLPVLLRLSQALDYPMSEILPRLGRARVRIDSIEPETRGTRALSHPELDLAIHGVGLQPGEEATIEVAKADALVFVVSGQCLLEIPGHTVELEAGDSADVTMADTVALRTSTELTALVIVGADRYTVKLGNK